MYISKNSSYLTKLPTRSVLSLICLAILTFNCVAAQADVTPVGRYGKLHISGEHCDGLIVDLWKRDGSFVGFLHSCSGLIDTQRDAVLDKADHDASDGGFAFSVSLSVGLDYLGHGKEVPSKDVWTFKGHLTSDSLYGKLRKADLNRQHGPIVTESLKLPRQPTALPSFPDETVWRQWGVAHPGISQ